MDWIAMPSPAEIAEQYRIALLNHARLAGQPLGPISPARMESALNAYQLLSNPRLAYISDEVLTFAAVGLLRK